MAGQLKTYRDEVFNFLRTVTIKFEPFAYLMGSKYMQQYGLVDPHQSWNPYYINLTGEYSANDTRMQVYSIETGTMVSFDKTLAKRYPKTAALYKLPNKEYHTLEERYPNNVGLIRTIAYPIADMETALKAPNFALLGFDASLLEQNERSNMISALQNFLTMVRDRWWVKEYCYEDMYAVTFWAMLWQLLPNLLLMQRFLNIKTPYVHSYHIWEYLTSKGLRDYRDALTYDQSNWLYRNIDYILHNRGKYDNLKKLAEELLDEVFVSVIEKDLIINTDDFDNDNYTPNPEYQSTNVATGEKESKEDHDSIHEKLVETGLDEDKTIDELTEEKKSIVDNPYNELPTKLLEFKKENVNTSNASLMVNFFLDTIINRYSNGDLDYSVSIIDPLTKDTGEVCKLEVGDALAFWYYACKKSIGEEPVEIPVKYMRHIPFKVYKPDISDINLSVYYNSTEYNIRELINLDQMLDEYIPWHNSEFRSVDDFADNLSEQFRTLLNLLTCMEQSNKFMYHRAMQSFFNDVRDVGWVEFKLSEAKNYVEWAESIPCVKDIIDRTNSQADQEGAWTDLEKSIFDALFPIDYSKYKEFMGDIRYLENIYVSIRNLFIQLGSYNITYLETDRAEYKYMRIREPEFYTANTLYDMDNFWALVIEAMIFIKMKGHSTIYLELPDVDATCYIKSADWYRTYKNELVVGIDWSRKTTNYDYGIIQDRTTLENKSQITHYNQSITIETH